MHHITFPVSEFKKATDSCENALGHRKTGEWPRYGLMLEEYNSALGQASGLKFLCLWTMLTKHIDSKPKGVRSIKEPKDQRLEAWAATFVDHDGSKSAIETSLGSGKIAEAFGPLL